jgi:hypothetical protein
MTTPAQQGKSEGVDTRARPEVPDRLIAEAEQLHADVEMAAHATTPWSGPAARRRLRAAKNAEADLLRVLGFDSYAELRSVVGRASSRPVIDLTETPTVARDSTRTREIERALGAALAEIEVLRTKLVGGPGGAPDAVSPPEVVVRAGEIEALLGSLVSEIQRAAAEVQELHTVVAQVHELAVDTSARLVLAKLEVFVVARRERAGADRA